MIPWLLSIDEQHKALSKAIESSDTNVVYLVVFHILLKVATEKTFQARIHEDGMLPVRKWWLHIAKGPIRQQLLGSYYQIENLLGMEHGNFDSCQLYFASKTVASCIIWVAP